MAQRLLVIHGPNLNLLGTREPDIYGHETLDDINQGLQELAARQGAQCAVFQSNSEGALIDRIHAARNEQVDFIIINAGAYTHTSVAIRDALVGVGIPFIEVHISNVYKRESFRHRSCMADVAQGVVAGLGVFGYQAALQYALMI